MAILVFGALIIMHNISTEERHGTQRAKFARKVHKPPLGVNVINFEINGFNVFL